LEKTDFVFPKGATSLTLNFNNNYKLSVNIEKLFPTGGFTSDTVEIFSTFNNTYKLSGKVPDNILWNSGKKFDIVSMNGGSPVALPFVGCSLADQVPVSWGGTASDDIIEKSLKEKYNDLLARIEALEK
jgi:hypothetical protein